MRDIPILLLVVWDLFAMGFFAIGIYIIRTPARKLLQWDRRTGHGIYKWFLKLQSTEENAVEAAGCFYKLFGSLLLVMSGVHIIVTSALLVAKLLSN